MSEWIEARIKRGRSPSELYQVILDEVSHVHHFWDEPWWEWAFVVRLKDYTGDADELPERCDAVDHVVEWDPSADEKLYGGAWPYAQDFFQASSVLATCGEHLDQIGKLEHCFLNARGFGYTDEYLWAKRNQRRLRRYLRRNVGRFFTAKWARITAEYRQSQREATALAELRDE